MNLSLLHNWGEKKIEIRGRKADQAMGVTLPRRGVFWGRSKRQTVKAGNSRDLGSKEGPLKKKPGMGKNRGARIGVMSLREACAG